MSQKATLLSSCGELVRQNDSDRFLCALMAPAVLREKLFTLLAFNQEIAKIGNIVSEPILGQMRLQWWCEAVEAMTNGRPSPAHEVAVPLGILLKDQPDLAPLLLALLDARERDLDDAPFASAQELADYARATSAPLLKAMGDDNPDVATAYALVGLLRAGYGRGLEREVAHMAVPLLAGAAKGQARMWQAVARLYLKMLIKSGYDTRDSRFRLPHPRRGLSIFWASFFA